MTNNHPQKLKFGGYETTTKIYIYSVTGSALLSFVLSNVERANRIDTTRDSCCTRAYISGMDGASGKT